MSQHMSREATVVGLVVAWLLIAVTLPWWASVSAGLVFLSVLSSTSRV